MFMDTRARLLALWIGLLAPILVIIQLSPGGIFISPPLHLMALLAIFLLLLGVYAYQTNRLTPSKVISVALGMIVLFSLPVIL